MDSSQLSDRIVARRVTPAVDDIDAFDDCGAYACLRGTRERAVMIDFRFLNGNHEAFAYATLERVSFDPSEGLTLHFLGVQIRVRGRNFALQATNGMSLLEAIHRQRVPWLREIEELRGQFLPKNTVVVSRIEVRESK